MADGIQTFFRFGQPFLHLVQPLQQPDLFIPGLVQLAQEQGVGSGKAADDVFDKIGVVLLYQINAFDEAGGAEVIVNSSLKDIDVEFM